MSVLTELKRRHVIRVLIAYAIAGWVVVEGADVILPDLGVPPWVGSAVTWTYLLGFIPVALLAWIFEWTPEGLKRDLGLAGPAPDENSIAVLPFVNMSDDPANEFFSDGISEELLNLLAKVPQLKVISRSSAFSFKGQNMEIAEIARRLNVAHIMEGSVRKDGRRVRITAQLIRVDGDYHLWSDTWDRQVDDIFAIQDEIAAKVVDELKITLLGTVPESKEIDPEAFSLYLQARHLARQSSPNSLEKAVELYLEVLNIEPRMAEAWAGLSRTYNNQISGGRRPAKEALALGREAAQKAIEVDPGFALGHARLGWITMSQDADFPSAAAHVQTALDLEPGNPSVAGIAAIMLMHLGRLEDAIPLEKYSASRDPVYTAPHYNLGLAYLYAGYTDKAIERFETVLRLSPRNVGGQAGMGEAMLVKGDPNRALDLFQSVDSGLVSASGQAMAYHDLGDADRSDAMLARLMSEDGPEDACEAARVYAYRDEPDKAFESMEAEYERRGSGAFSQLLFDAFFSNLHDDPRWMAFRERIGMSPEEIEAIDLRIDASLYTSAV